MIWKPQCQHVRSIDSGTCASFKHLQTITTCHCVSLHNIHSNIHSIFTKHSPYSPELRRINQLGICREPCWQCHSIGSRVPRCRILERYRLCVFHQDFHVEISHVDILKNGRGWSWMVVDGRGWSWMVAPVCGNTIMSSRNLE